MNLITIILIIVTIVTIVFTRVKIVVIIILLLLLFVGRVVIKIQSLCDGRLHRRISSTEISTSPVNTAESIA